MGLHGGCREKVLYSTRTSKDYLIGTTTQKRRRGEQGTNRGEGVYMSR